VLAGVLARDGAQLSALQTQEQSFAAAGNLAVLHAQWQAVTSAARTECWRQLMTDALPEAHRGELGPQARWLWRALRTAELAGLDPAEVLTTAIRQRSLTGARDIASVIDARIRRRIAGLVPLPQPAWCQRIPDHVPAGHGQYAAGLAAAMDQGTQRIGEHAAEHQPPWALSALGPVPADPLDRLAWQHKASAIGAYRELAGITDPAEPIGPEPVAADPDLRAAWHDAFACLGPAHGPDVRALTDGDLHLLRDGYRTETQWAPRYVTGALRNIRIGAADAELQAIRRDALARASRDHDRPDAAAANEKLAGSYRAMAAIYRSYELTLAATEQDRRQWQAITEQPRQLAIAADNELRRRRPQATAAPVSRTRPRHRSRASPAQPHTWRPDHRDRAVDHRAQRATQHLPQARCRGAERTPGRRPPPATPLSDKSVDGRDPAAAPARDHADLENPRARARRRPRSRSGPIVDWCSSSLPRRPSAADLRELPCRYGPLAKDLVHYLGTLGERGTYLVPVDQFCRCSAVVPGQ
jgi:hypothetical protein